MELPGIHVKYIVKIFFRKIDSIYTHVDSVREYSFPHFLLSLGTLILYTFLIHKKEYITIIYIFDYQYIQIVSYLSLVHYLNLWYINLVFKFMVHCQFVSWLNFLLESLIFFLSHKMSFIHEFITHSSNKCF